MLPRDMLILAGFGLACTLLYLLLCALPPRNRTGAGLRAVCLGGGLALLLTLGIWHTVFAGPLSRNWGLGGAYGWMAVCPALYLVSGIAATVRNLLRKEKTHDRNP